MTVPTTQEMDEIRDASPTVGAALEFVWTFTEWWEALEVDLEEIPGDLDTLLEMERAYERWRNLR